MSILRSQATHLLNAGGESRGDTKATNHNSAILRHSLPCPGMLRTNQSCAPPYRMILRPRFRKSGDFQPQASSGQMGLIMPMHVSSRITRNGRPHGLEGFTENI